MKNFKRIASLMLALVLALTALSLTAFAAEEKGSITISNPAEGKTYTAYKIFDVLATEDYEGVSYSIEESSAWYNVVKTFGEQENSNLTLTKSPNPERPTTYLVTTEDGFSAAAFAAYLKANKPAGASGAEIKDGKLTGLELGYYFVMSSDADALCNLTTTQPAATIRDKNDVPFEKTTDKESVEVGETVPFVIAGKVPDTTGFTTYTYLITDEMSDGLTFQKDVKVMVSGNDETGNCTVSYDVDGNANKFTVSIPVKNYTIGAEIKVTYSAVVNENAVAKVENNKATLTYSNDPTTEGTTTTTPVEEKVYTAKIVIDKFETGNKDIKLAGAKFVLKNADGDQYYKYTAASTEAPKTDAKVEWVTDKEQATVIETNAQGEANILGLKNGVYQLEETEAPKGYNMLTAAKEITIHGNEADTTSLTVKAEVENGKGALLPETGGMGTTIFYVFGSLLVVGAAVLLVTKKRMNNAK